ncbi:MAG: Uma2 family endonuclease [Cyanobacteriota bacterium]|nr:Uma2 family endonuclease [Cyanobacteriota bacterium]
METQRHKMQMDLLIDSLGPWLEEREDGYVGGNMFVYFSPAQVRNHDFKGPDFFAVLGVPKTERKSWVVWEEGKAPDIVIELLSESTRERDKTDKKQIYQDRLRVPEYFWYDPFNSSDCQGFSLQNGAYVSLDLQDNRYISDRLGLALVCWEGTYKNVPAVWLRWETLDGELLPTPAEFAQQEAERAQQKAERAQQEAEQAQQETERAQQEAEREKQKAQELEALLERYRDRFGELPE